MHIFSFTLPEIIMKQGERNDCYLFLKVEQEGEKYHQIWNLLTRRKFFAIKEKKKQLLYTFLELENLLYLDKKMFNKK